ncbi:MAG TPA: hypothetical protein VHR86_09355, partial [Armatimonadota bacterium]|nr:hypothetical protein [Armatimonadota bacterium]
RELRGTRPAIQKRIHRALNILIGRHFFSPCSLLSTTVHYNTAPGGRKRLSGFVLQRCLIRR